MRGVTLLVGALLAMTTGGCATRSADSFPAGQKSLSIFYEYDGPRIGSWGFYREGRRYSLRFADASGRYTSANMTVLVDERLLPAFDGTVVVDRGRGRIRVDLYRLDPKGQRAALPVNGAFRIDKLAERAQRASDRVKFVLAGIKGDTHVGLRTVIAYWYRGTELLADDVMWQQARGAFESWEHHAGLDRGFSTYRITGADVLEGIEPPSIVVSVIIDGTDLRVLVPDGRPMVWQP
jgi:hypothetical protein